MEEFKSPNFDNAIQCIDDVYSKLSEILRSRNCSDNELKIIRQHLNDLASLLADLQCQEAAAELYTAKNRFNAQINDINQFAVLVANAKKSVTNAKKHIINNKEMYFKDADFLNSKDVNIENTKLEVYFKSLKDKQVQTITFVNDYVQIGFVHGGMSCISETFITNKDGSFQIPSKEGNWQICKLIGKDIISAEEKGNEVILKAEDGTEISVNTRLGPQGDTFHITAEGLPTLHF